MAVTLPQAAPRDEVLSSDGRKRMAKVDVRFPDDLNPLYVEIGGALDEVRRVAGLSLEEFAFAIGKNDRQVARWFKGQDRPQLEAVFAVERFRALLVVALARITPDLEVSTEMRTRRIAS